MVSRHDAAADAVDTQEAAGAEEPRGIGWWALRILLVAIALFAFTCLRPV